MVFRHSKEGGEKDMGSGSHVAVRSQWARRSYKFTGTMTARGAFRFIPGGPRGYLAIDRAFNMAPHFGQTGSCVRIAVATREIKTKQQRMLSIRLSCLRENATDAAFVFFTCQNK